MSRFKKREAPFPKLDPAEISTVFLGHTHRRLLYELPVKNGQGARYWNVGAWARGRVARGPATAGSRTTGIRWSGAA